MHRPSATNYMYSIRLSFYQTEPNSEHLRAQCDVQESKYQARRNPEDERTHTRRVKLEKQGVHQDAQIHPYNHENIAYWVSRHTLYSESTVTTQTYDLKQLYYRIECLRWNLPQRKCSVGTEISSGRSSDVILVSTIWRRGKLICDYYVQTLDSEVYLLLLLSCAALTFLNPLIY